MPAKLLMCCSRAKTALFLALAAVGAAAWWNHPLGGLAAVIAIQTLVGMAFLRARASTARLSDRFAWDRRQLSLRIALLAVEVLVVLMVVAHVAGDAGDEVLLNLGLGFWAVLAYAREVQIGADRVGYDEFGGLLRGRLVDLGVSASTGGLFCLVRGDLFDGAALIGYGVGSWLAGRFWERTELRRWIGIAQTGSVAVAGVVQWLI